MLFRSIHNIRPIDQEEFDWSPNVQGLVLGSFFYGYVLTQIVGGKFSDRSIQIVIF